MGIGAKLKGSALTAPLLEARNQAYGEYRLRTVLRATAKSRYRTVRTGPEAPEAVVAATALMRWDQLKQKSARSRFVWSGKSAMAELTEAAVSAGLDLSDAAAVLELGCGGARLIRHLRRIEDLQLVASDALRANTEWCKENVADITFHHNELEPPLAFARENEFDFVFAYSVFSHIPIALQRPWISEIERILKPGGFVAITVLGRRAAEVMMTADEYRQFEETGDFTMDPEHPGVSASSAHIGSWDVFMTEERLRHLYSGVLDVVSYGTGFQTPVVLSAAR